MLRAILVLILFALATSAPLPVVIQYSSYITDLSKKPRTDLKGRTVYFRLYTDSTGGTSVWSDEQTITSSNGYVNLSLGSKANNRLPARLVDSISPIWLEMELATEEPFPRQKIASSFYSISANFADTADYSKMAGTARNSNNADSLVGFYGRSYLHYDTAGNFKVGMAKESNSFVTETKTDSNVGFSLHMPTSENGRHTPYLFLSSGPNERCGVALQGVFDHKFPYQKALAFYAGWGLNSSQPNPGVSDMIERMRIDPIGRVGINTKSPSDFLDVNGGATISGDLRVFKDLYAFGKIYAGDSLLFPDYVFGDSYDLRPLAEVERYIIKNNHLPGMPTAEQVKKEGLDLVSMNTKLLEKVEELTLYIIDIEKRLKQIEPKQE